MAKAAVFMGPNKDFEIREYPISKVSEGYARMSLIASGICGTDIHFYNGTLSIDPPKILGHEFIGRVEDILEEDSKEYGISLGDKVIVNIASPCGMCLLCQEGDDANCVNMGVTNGGNPEVSPHYYGGFGQVNYTPVKNLIKIPSDLNPYAVTAFACAGATSLHAFSLGKVDFANINVAIVQGLGPVGIFAAMYMARMGVCVIAITRSKNEERERLAKEIGIARVFNLKENTKEEILEYIRGKNRGYDADLAFEGSGSIDALPLGMELLRNRGIYLVPGQYSFSGSVEINPELITFKALQIIGSSQYSTRDVEAYLDFLGSNKDLIPLIEGMIRKYRVEEINQAIKDMKARKNIKTILVGD